MSPETTDPGEIEIYDSKAFYACWFVGTAFLAVASLALPGVGPVGLVVFGSHAVWAVTRLESPRPRIRVTPEGLIDENFWYSPGLIPWDEILDVRPTRWGLIEVDLRDEDAFWRRLPALSRLARSKMQLLGFGPAVITPWGLNRSRAEVVGLLASGLDEHLIAEVKDDAARGVLGGPERSE
jgi:hypothetical protein